ncbi:cutinase family protein [Nocardia wallacei]|uniref:cutinase family protein n=1 Tax=Nocardia wallacei TaxID=480035 RepID=UPI002458C3A4|nr:cutinase family protein [Nocardia wallacei]
MLFTPRRPSRLTHPTATGPSSRRRISAVASAATFALATAIATAGVAAADPGPATAGCPRWTAVLVPGTGETHPAADPTHTVGMLAPIGDGLRARYGPDIDVRTVGYTAAPAPYAPSETAGVQALTATLSGLCESTRVVMAGYSQGADVVGDATAAIGHGQGPVPADRVVAVGLISDPRRDPGTPQLGPAVAGEGMAGPRAQDFGALTGRVRTVCAEGDIYCATSPEASPALAAVGRAFTGNPTLLDDPSQGSTGTPGSLDPSSVTRQVVNVLAGLAGFAANVPAIVNDLAQLPPLIAVGDIPGLHRVSGDLNNLFSPLVRMADKADLHLVARALSMAAPLDTSGWTGVAAQIVDILAGVDVGRVATDIGEAQEIAWRAVEKLTIGDPIGGGLELVGFVPVAADLAAAAASTLSGDAGTQLSGLAQTFTSGTDPATTAALTDLARQGGDAAQFAASGVHQNGYTDAVRQMLEWLTSQLDGAR